MNPVDKMIWKYFHVHSGDTPPIMGFEGTRDTFGVMFRELGYKTGAEVGVQRGAYSEVLMKANPGLNLKLVDTWGPFTHHSQSWQDRQLERAQERMKPYKNVEFIKIASVDAAKTIPNGSLDFVYIDALHDFDSAMMDIIVWVPKVRTDGIVAGHDYEHYYGFGVTNAVDAYAHAHNVPSYYITAKDTPKSWFWRK